VLATKTDKDDKVLWKRPSCAFPQKAACLGAGEMPQAIVANSRLRAKPAMQKRPGSEAGPFSFLSA